MKGIILLFTGKGLTLKHLNYIHIYCSRARTWQVRVLKNQQAVTLWSLTLKTP